jgi:hypothetical protein
VADGPTRVEAGINLPLSISLSRLASSQRCDSFQMVFDTMAAALKLLEEIIDNPKVKASERFEAMRTLKKYLVQLKRLSGAQDTAPDVRENIIKVLREYTA